MSHIPFQFRRDTAANWTSNNPILKEGELGLETASGNVTGVKAGNGTDAWTALGYIFSTSSAEPTGWAYYEDTAAAQAFASGVRTLFTNNAGTTLDAQKPSDVTTFWTGNAVQGVDGDDRVVRVQFEATPSDATAASVLIELDIGGAIGLIDAKRVPIVTGSGVAQNISEAFELFCGATFEANGCQVFLTFDGPVSVNEKTILVKRGHPAK